LKRALILMWLIVSLAALCLAHSSEDNGAAAAPPDVSVINFEWKYAGYVRAEAVKQNESASGSDASTGYKVSRKNIYVFKYAAIVKLKNAGAKTIKSVSWDYIFTDVKEQKELKRYSLQARQQIQPGATQTLTRDVSIDPKDNTRHITTGKQSIEITKIEYMDGSAWKQKQ
jgi:hypothetical protein